MHEPILSEHTMRLTAYGVNRNDTGLVQYLNMFGYNRMAHCNIRKSKCFLSLAFPSTFPVMAYADNCKYYKRKGTQHDLYIQAYSAYQEYKQ